MNRLKIKYWLCALSVIMGIVFFQGCGVDYSSGVPQYSFIEPVQIVEVDVDTISFRIVVKYIEGEYRYEGDPYVYLDTLNTTARHNIHFINHVDTLTGPDYDIGDFIPMNSDNMFYRDVELLPENIKREVSIYYYMGYGRVDVELNDRLEVILRPKTNEK